MTRNEKENVKNMLSELEKHLNILGKKNSKMINFLESNLSKKISILVEFPRFYSMPLNNIANIVKKVDFKDVDNPYEFIYSLIKKLTKEHKDTHFILKSINCDDLNFSLKQCIDIISLFKNCPLLSKIVKLFDEMNNQPEYDYEYILKQKEEEIEKLREYMDSHNLIYLPEVNEKPTDFESNICKACSEGKLSSVQYLIEQEYIDKNLRESGLTPLHYACSNGHLSIVRYLIEIQHVDKEQKDDNESTPLMHASSKSLDIVKYLIEKQKVNIHAINKREESALHFAIKNGCLSNVKYLI